MEPKPNDSNNNNNCNNEGVARDTQSEKHIENKESVSLSDLNFLKSFMNPVVGEEIFTEL